MNRNGSEMNKKRKRYRIKEVKKENQSRFSIVLGSIILGYIFYTLCCTFVNHLRLKWYGEKKKAVVTKFIKYEGSNPKINYEFEVDGIKFTVIAVSVYEEKVVGDSIPIVYLPNNPEINEITEE